MQRKQQNQIILDKITAQLSDKPNVQLIINKAFTQWFQGLVQQGMQLLQPAMPAPAEGEPAPQEG